MNGAVGGINNNAKEAWLPLRKNRIGEILVAFFATKGKSRSGCPAAATE